MTSSGLLSIIISGTGEGNLIQMTRSFDVLSEFIIQVDTFGQGGEMLWI